MKRYDSILAIIFGILTLAFFILAFTNTSFFNWAYDRHQNQLSWFIRPVFLIPFCYFAYKRSRAGISFTIFCIFTSMFWFSKPEAVSEEVKAFLAFEKEWLTGGWSLNKVLLALTVPASFIALGMAFWKRSLRLGLAVITLMATGKISWSILNAGDPGKSILIPAIIGLLLCIGLIYWGFKQAEKKEANHRNKI